MAGSCRKPATFASRGRPRGPSEIALIPSPGSQNPYLASPVSYRSELPHRPRHDRFSSTRLGSAPGDRPGVVGESPIRRRSSDPRRPRAVRVWPRGQGRSVGRGPCRPAIEPRKSHSSGCRRCYQSGRPHERGRQREPPVDPAWSETLACTHAPGTGTGRSPARPAPAGPVRTGKARSRSR